MTNERVFYRCNLCGNIVGMVEQTGPVPDCCGQQMELLTPNTTDAAHEKHVPACTREGGLLKVQIGSVLHPATEQHHITWIAVAQDKRTQRIELEHTEAPQADFLIEDGPAKVYAYCNLHGLWSADA